MANLSETATFEAGVYQIETTDPVLGGPGGIANIQAQQLANRTKYLKQFADEVQTARGGFASLDDRLDRYDSFAPDQQTDLVAGIQEALYQAAIANREVENIRKRVLAQGVVTIKNKFVVQGFVLTKSDIRALHLSQTGTVDTGISRAMIDGAVLSMADNDYVVSVPQNTTAQAVTYYAYLWKNGGGVYEIGVGTTVPTNGLTLYRLTIPANDTANNLNAVTLTDLRVIQTIDGWTTSVTPSVYVALPFTLPAADYHVVFNVESATDVTAVGSLKVSGKQANGFTINMTGSADNVQVRWTLLNVNYA